MQSLEAKAVVYIAVLSAVCYTIKRRNSESFIYQLKLFLSIL